MSTTEIRLEVLAEVAEHLMKKITTKRPYGIGDLYSMVERKFPKLKGAELRHTTDLALGYNLRGYGIIYILKEDGTVYFRDMKQKEGNA